VYALVPACVASEESEPIVKEQRFSIASVVEERRFSAALGRQQKSGFSPPLGRWCNGTRRAWT